ncbi:hypothetical protein MRB53_040048 [Persea americana]|nr:hypothetical protein MRB53_040048 [Persea americana]
MTETVDVSVVGMPAMSSIALRRAIKYAVLTMRKQWSQDHQVAKSCDLALSLEENLFVTMLKRDVDIGEIDLAEIAMTTQLNVVDDGFKSGSKTDRRSRFAFVIQSEFNVDLTKNSTSRSDFVHRLYLNDGMLDVVSAVGEFIIDRDRVRKSVTAIGGAKVQHYHSDVFSFLLFLSDIDRWIGGDIGE